MLLQTATWPEQGFRFRLHPKGRAPQTVTLGFSLEAGSGLSVGITPEWTGSKPHESLTHRGGCESHVITGLFLRKGRLGMKRVLDPGGQLAMADLFQFLWISWLSFSFSLLLVFLGNLGLCQRYQACAAGPCTVGRRPPRAGKGL